MADLKRKAKTVQINDRITSDVFFVGDTGKLRKRKPEFS